MAVAVDAGVAYVADDCVDGLLPCMLPLVVYFMLRLAADVMSAAGDATDAAEEVDADGWHCNSL